MDSDLSSKQDTSNELDNIENQTYQNSSNLMMQSGKK